MSSQMLCITTSHSVQDSTTHRFTCSSITSGKSIDPKTSMLLFAVTSSEYIHHMSKTTSSTTTIDKL